MSTVDYAHITIAGDNVPVLTGTRIKVAEIALDHLAYRWDAPEIHRQFPQLSLGQIHSALAFYYDHQVEMDADIRHRREVAQQIRTRLGDGPITDALRATRQSP